MKVKKCFIPPVEKILGVSNNTGETDTFQYVPILKTLEVICNKDDVLGHIMCPPANDDKIESFRDGSIFKENPLFSENPASIQFILYSDEFVPVNKLGNKKRKDKITGFYFVIGNVPRKLRSRLKDIKLAILCRSKHITTYGYNQIISPFMNGIKVLENGGLSFNNHGNEIKLLGTISMIVADNLASHALGGFNQSFSPNVIKVCRYCNALQSDICVHFHDTHFEQRTATSYEEQATIVEEFNQFSWNLDLPVFFCFAAELWLVLKCD